MARILRDESPEASSPKGKAWRRGLGNRKQAAADVAAQAARKQRRARVFELKAATAATFDAIGRELGISGRQAKKDYTQAALEYGQETAAEHKAKANQRFDAQLGRLNRALLKLLPLVERPDGTAPDLEAVARLTAITRTAGMITATQAKMNGAFAPAVVEVKHEHNVANVSLEEALRVAGENVGESTEGPTIQ